MSVGRTHSLQVRLLQISLAIFTAIAVANIAKARASFPYQKLKALLPYMRCLPLVTMKLNSRVEAKMNLTAERSHSLEVEVGIA